MSDESTNIEHLVEIWKKTVDVQQHFNDLEMRIRNFALALLAAVLSAAALVMRDGLYAEIPWVAFLIAIPLVIFIRGAYNATTRSARYVYGLLSILIIAGAVWASTSGLYSHVPRVRVTIAALILLAGVISWAAFYFMDRYWYHPLLVGSVRHGQALETELTRFLGVPGLTQAIGDASPVTLAGRRIHSSEKMTIFYGAVLVVLLTLFVGAMFAQPVRKSDIQKTEVTNWPKSIATPPNDTALPQQPASGQAKAPDTARVGGLPKSITEPQTRTDSARQ